MCSKQAFLVYFSAALVTVLVGTLPSRVGIAEEEAPRYRLGEAPDLSSIAPQRSDDAEVSVRDFEWEALTKNGPASGADPIIGDARVSSYYDFKDGQPHPYFVVQKKKSAN